MPAKAELNQSNRYPKRGSAFSVSTIVKNIGQEFVQVGEIGGFRIFPKKPLQSVIPANFVLKKVIVGEGREFTVLTGVPL